MKLNNIISFISFRKNDIKDVENYIINFKNNNYVTVSYGDRKYDDIDYAGVINMSLLSFIKLAEEYNVPYFKYVDVFNNILHIYTYENLKLVHEISFILDSSQKLIDEINNNGNFNLDNYTYPISLLFKLDEIINKNSKELDPDIKLYDLPKKAYLTMFCHSNSTTGNMIRQKLYKGLL